MPRALRAAADWIYANALAAVACAAGALLGIALNLGSASPSQNWPEVGIGLVVARLLGVRVFAGIWLVAFFTVDEPASQPGTKIGGLPLQFLVSAILTGQILLAAQILRIAPNPNPLATRRGVFALVLAGLGAGFAGNTIRMIAGVLLDLSTLEIFTRFSYRVSKFVSGILLVSPIAFMAACERLPPLSRRRWLEIFGVLCALAFSTVLASTNLFPFFQAYQQMMILLVLPLTLWATLRAGSWGAALAIFVASLFPIWGTIRGWSAFGVPASTTAEILTHIYLVTVSATTLTVGAVLRERGNALEQLKEAKSDLVAKVESRTEDLRRERDFGSAIFDSIGAVIFVLRDDGTVIRLNRTGQDILGLPLHEVAGRTLWDLGVIPPEDVEAVRAWMERNEPTGETRLIAKDGSRRIFQWSNTRLNARDAGDEDFVISIGTDITDRRKAQEEAMEAIKARDLFLSVASHELRTPLTTLQLQLQSMERFVERAKGLPREIPTRLHLALRQTRRLGGLINELLDVSRITHGKIAPERAEVDLAEVVHEVVDRYRIALEQSGSELVVRGIDEAMVGFWDPLRVDQIVDNLLSNAIKYGEGKPIEIAIERIDDKARICVADHGIGISPKDQKRIFDRFERAVSTRYYGGFGLGLWITRQVVQAHGGSIRVESEPGQGSTFIVELPLCAQA